MKVIATDPAKTNKRTSGKIWMLHMILCIIRIFSFKTEIITWIWFYNSDFTTDFINGTGNAKSSAEYSKNFMIGQLSVRFFV